MAASMLRQAWYVNTAPVGSRNQEVVSFKTKMVAAENVGTSGELEVATMMVCSIGSSQ